MSHLSASFKQRHPELPWRSIPSFRNRLAHGYLDVKVDRVWDVIVLDLPVLRTIVEQEIAQATTGDEGVG